MTTQTAVITQVNAPGRLRKYTLVWDVDGHFASVVTISRQGSDACSVASPALPSDYALRPLTTTDWRTRFTVAQKSAY